MYIEKSYCISDKMGEGDGFWGGFGNAEGGGDKFWEGDGEGAGFGDRYGGGWEFGDEYIGKPFKPFKYRI